MSMRVCVCVYVPPCLLAHPNTSRLITERESEGVGVEDPIPPFINERTKDGEFFPSPLHLLLLLLLLLPPSAPEISVGRLPQPYSHFPGPWRDTRTHTLPVTPSSHCGEKKKIRVRVNFACLHPPVRGERWIHRLKREELGVNFTSRLGRFLFYLWHLPVPQSVPPPPSSSLSLPLPSSVTTLSSVSLLCFLFFVFLPLVVLITRTSKLPYGHTATHAAHVSRAAAANDEGVCIPAPLLFHRLETLTQINRQHGPAITISASPLLPASLHSRLLLPTSALISRLQSLSRSSSRLCWRPRSHFLSSHYIPPPSFFFSPGSLDRSLASSPLFYSTPSFTSQH